MEGFKRTLDAHAADELEDAAAHVLTRFLVLSLAGQPPPALAGATYQVVMDDLLLALAMLNQRDSAFMARALAKATTVILTDLAAIRAMREEMPDLTSDELVRLLDAMKKVAS